MPKPKAKNPAKPAKKPAVLPVAPSLPYQPRDPRRYRPGIALVGCGGITKWHLTAYRNAGYRILVLCDVDRKRAAQRRDEFYPEADITDDYRAVLARDDVEVVDITTHPPERPPLVAAALRAHKNVLSQKPFVLDLNVGRRLADLADRMNVRLAVNQNGRWAPHFSYIREAASRGLLGQIDGVHCDVHWDHSWVKGGPFEKVHHLILYDFAIHWFDFVAMLLGGNARSVYATIARSVSQTIKPPLLGQAVIEFEGAQASLVFDGNTPFGPLDRVYVSGSKGTARSEGPTNDDQQVELTTKKGGVRPKLTGAWFPDGFHGAMGELLCAIEENREPSHSARNNLASLALCFAAVASAERGKPIVPGTIRKMPKSKESD